ncbi:hypothetical protein Lalb_Chr12g0206011 [Lupinus albus]|uniref:Uncharacterized protein n=1 Tax=Lupinus albus TaxID=3870 RepID=A0A6A4PNB3_LUPAL|nr:hypothetical protein Lalb_Chr12g0206011 [Lupinus albus]
MTISCFQPLNYFITTICETEQAKRLTNATWLPFGLARMKAIERNNKSFSMDSIPIKELYKGSQKQHEQEQSKR